MFQFPRCPPRMTPGCPAVRRAGCPIRRSPDHRLPAPPRGISPRGRVLPRPPTPRHPPCALHAEARLRLSRLDRRRGEPRGRTGARQQGRCRPPGATRLRTRARSHSRSRPDPARRLPSSRSARGLDLLARPAPPPAWPGAAALAASCRGLWSMYVSFFVQCARATRHERFPTPMPAQGKQSVSTTLGQMGARKLSFPRRSVPAAAEPGGFRVARCQSAWRASSPPEGDNPRPKSYADLGRSFPSSAVHGPLVILAGTASGSPQGWSRGDSNPGPPPCKGGALPAKLRPPAPRRPRRQPRPRPRPRPAGWARLDSNQGPRPYQGRALTT
jgi:hypothetical protein